MLYAAYGCAAVVLSLRLAMTGGLVLLPQRRLAPKTAQEECCKRLDAARAVVADSPVRTAQVQESKQAQAPDVQGFKQKQDTDRQVLQREVLRLPVSRDFDDAKLATKGFSLQLTDSMVPVVIRELLPPSRPPRHLLVGRQAIVLPGQAENKPRRRRRSKPMPSIPPLGPSNFDGLDGADGPSVDDVLCALRRKAADVVCQYTLPCEEVAGKECADPATTCSGGIDPVTPAPKNPPLQPKRKSEEEESVRLPILDAGTAVARVTEVANATKPALELPRIDMPANTLAQLPANDTKINREFVSGDRFLPGVGLLFCAAGMNAMPGRNTCHQKTDSTSSVTQCSDGKSDGVLSFSSSKSDFTMQGIGESIPHIGVRTIGKDSYVVVDLDANAFNEQFKKFDADISLAGRCFERSSLPDGFGDGRYSFLQGARLVVSYADESKICICTKDHAAEMRGRVQMLGAFSTYKAYPFERSATEILDSFERLSSRSTDSNKITHDLPDNGAHIQTMEDRKLRKM